MRLLFFITTLLVSLPALADVYTLGVGGHGAIKELLHRRGVLRENMSVNGAGGEIEVYVLPQSFAEIHDLLKRFLPKTTQIKGNAITVQSSAAATAERFLFVSMGEKKKTIVYRLQTSKISDKEPAWPAHLPRPAGATVRQVTTLKNRGGTYAEAKIGGPAASSIRRYSQDLEHAGWSALAGNPESGVFIRKNKMIILAAEPTKSGRWSILGVYEREVKGQMPAPSTRPKPPK